MSPNFHFSYPSSFSEDPSHISLKNYKQSERNLHSPGPSSNMSTHCISFYFLWTLPVLIQIKTLSLCALPDPHSSVGFLQDPCLAFTVPEMVLPSNSSRYISLLLQVPLKSYLLSKAFSEYLLRKRIPPHNIIAPLTHVETAFSSRVFSSSVYIFLFCIFSFIFYSFH